MEILLWTGVILWIGTLILVSMCSSGQKEGSLLSRYWRKQGKSFFRWFFLGLLVPILFFVALGGLTFLLCTKGYCTISTIVPMLSGLGVLWVSLRAIRFITPFFIGEVAKAENASYRTMNDMQKQSMKNLTNYIIYAFLLGLLLFILLFIDPRSLAESSKDFLGEIGISRSILEGEYFGDVMAWLFYVLNISALIGIISTLKMIANDSSRRVNDRLQQLRLRAFEERNTRTTSFGQ